MEEVVVKRHNAAAVGYIFVIIIGLVLIICGSIIAACNEENRAGVLVVSLVIGGLILAMGIFYTVRFFMLPAKVVVFRDGVLYFPRKMSCRPEQLEKVFIRIYRNTRSGAVSRYGKLEVTVGGKVYKYTDIANVEAAQSRLLELNKEAIERLSQPEEPVTVGEAPAQAPSDDPFAE